LAITSDTRFEIASVTKTFTASGILILRDRGRLTFDDPVSRYLPDFPNGDHITIKNLLSHTSGLGLGELPSTASPRMRICRMWSLLLASNRSISGQDRAIGTATQAAYYLLPSSRKPQVSLARPLLNVNYSAAQE
jgi:CubicO group peptidase (beta-lactamase class C family)